MDLAEKYLSRAYVRSACQTLLLSVFARVYDAQE